MRKLLSLRHAALIPLLLASCFAINPGCAWYAPAAAERAFSPGVTLANQALWPTRNTERLEQIIRMGPDVLSLRVKHDRLVDGKIVSTPKRLPPKDATYSGLYGRGLIRAYKENPEKPEPGRLLSSGFCFFSGIDTAPSVLTRRVSRLVEPEADGGPEARVNRKSRRAPWAVNLRGTWLRLDEPLSGSPRGLVVHLTSYGGYRFEKPVIQEMRERGWAVLWVDSSTVKPETTRVDVDTQDLDSAADRLAQNISDRVSEIAYAVEAALEYLEAERPDIPQSPTILMGYSAGALASPTVAALLPDRFDAAVMVGGGANLLDISQRSVLTDGGLKLNWTRGTPSTYDQQRLQELYLQACPLDPYWTAQSLRGKPVLLLHAVFDRIVPAANGDLLYEQLGRPERMNFLLGHELLFLRLGAQSRMLADWVDDAAAGAAANCRK